MIQTDMCFVLLQVPEDLKRQADKRIKALTTGKVQSVVMCAHMYCFSQHALWSCPFPLPFSSRIHLITHLSHTSPLTHTTPPTLPLTHFTPHTSHTPPLTQDTTDMWAEKSFCKRVSRTEYESQMKATSQQSISSLLDRIASDENMTDKERKQKLKLVRDVI